MMFSLNEINQCIENCQIAGDSDRDSSKFKLAAVMIIFVTNDVDKAALLENIADKLVLSWKDPSIESINTDSNDSWYKWE